MRLIMELGSWRYVATTSAERDQDVDRQHEALGDGEADGVAVAALFVVVAHDDHQVDVAILVFFAAGAAAEEDDLLGFEALDDELGDGLDGFPVERVFDDAHWSLQRHSGVGVSGGEVAHLGKDTVFGAVAAELGLVVALDDGGSGEDVGGVVAGEAVEVEVVGVEAGGKPSVVSSIAGVPDFTAAPDGRHCPEVGT